MFQYAAGLYYAQRCGSEMCIAVDPEKHSVSHGDPRPFLLSHFAISAPCHECTVAERLLLVTGHPRLQPLAGPLLQNLLGVQVAAERVEQRFRFLPDLEIGAKVDTVYLTGYWQVHNIADAISADLRKEFSFREAPKGRNAELLRQIQSAENPVSLHIRRGDYTLAVEGNVALPMDYYAKAIAKIRQSVGEPTFFVFSDDMAFAKENFRDLPAVFVDHNDSFSAHEDLRLMSSCRHNIIANSSFSWWGAWLNSHPDKIVIAPRNWMVGKSAHYDDLLPREWQLLG